MQDTGVLGSDGAAGKVASARSRNVDTTRKRDTVRAGELEERDDEIARVGDSAFFAFASRPTRPARPAGSTTDRWPVLRTTATESARRTSPGRWPGQLPFLFLFGGTAIEVVDDARLDRRREVPSEELLGEGDTSSRPDRRAALADYELKIPSQI